MVVVAVISCCITALQPVDAVAVGVINKLTGVRMEREWMEGRVEVRKMSEVMRWGGQLLSRLPTAGALHQRLLPSAFPPLTRGWNKAFSGKTRCSSSFNTPQVHLYFWKVNMGWAGVIIPAISRGKSLGGN